MLNEPKHSGILTPPIAASHLDEAEGVVLLHEALDAAADLLETRLVLADPGDVLLDCRPVGVIVSARDIPISADEAKHPGFRLLGQLVHALLGVVQKLLDEGEGDGARNVIRTKRLLWEMCRVCIFSESVVMVHVCESAEPELCAKLPYSASPSLSAPGVSSLPCCTSSQPCTAAYPACPGEHSHTDV